MIKTLSRKPSPQQNQRTISRFYHWWHRSQTFAKTFDVILIYINASRYHFLLCMFQLQVGPCVRFGCKRLLQCWFFFFTLVFTFFVTCTLKNYILYMVCYTYSKSFFICVFVKYVSSGIIKFTMNHSTCLVCDFVWYPSTLILCFWAVSFVVSVIIFNSFDCWILIILTLIIMSGLVTHQILLI